MLFVPKYVFIVKNVRDFGTFHKFSDVSICTYLAKDNIDMNDVQFKLEYKLKCKF